jgi:hypothetical protein
VPASRNTWPGLRACPAAGHCADSEHEGKVASCLLLLLEIKGFYRISRTTYGFSLKRDGVRFLGYIFMISWKDMAKIDYML